MEAEMEEKVKKLQELKRKAALGGGEHKIAQVHAKGKLTARERIDMLLDPGSFVELNMLVQHEIGAPGDGIVCGHGTIDGRVVCIYSQDPTVFGGSIGALHGYKMYRTVERALDMRVPLIGLHDSPGARALKMGTPGAWDAARARDEKSGNSIFFANTQASGVVPQISAILGSCAGISVYSPALTDFVFMVEGISHMFITGPRVVKSVMAEELTMEELGGAKVHSRLSGVADFRVKSEEECFTKIRKLLSFLPSCNEESPPVVDTGDDPERRDDEIADIVPCSPYKSYDMRKVITRIVDNADFLEVKGEFAPEIVVGFGRLAGHTVGIVANQPMVRAGSMTVNSSDKQARFIRFCDCFNIPLVFLIDTPAYMPGSEQEHAGIIRHGAKVLYALCEAVVPRVAVVLRKAYGGGNLGMGVVPGMGTDFVFAWPIAEIGVLGAEQTVDLFYADEIQKAENPDEYRAQKVREYREQYANPFSVASDSTHIEDIIEPRDTRWRLIKALELLRHKKVWRQPKRHGNIPL
jgi:acetyl-CoA carboxylase carboxyltransferase component